MIAGAFGFLVETGEKTLHLVPGHLALAHGIAHLIFSLISASSNPDTHSFSLMTIVG